MRIISKIPDYYDGASAFGVDTTTVFDRRPTLIDVNHPFYKTLKGEIRNRRINYGRTIRYNASPESKGRHRKPIDTGYELFDISIIVASKEYYGYRVQKTLGLSINEKPYYNFFWTIRDFLDWMKEIVPDKFYNEQDIIDFNFSNLRGKNFDSYVALDISEKLRDFMLENIIVNITHDIRRVFNSTDIIINSDNLGLYKLQRIVPPELMFSEIDQWVSMMDDPSRKMVEISDKSKIEKHGLDKWSFRKKVR